ncbi:MAG TPA: nucleotidyltransferase domain-containing protein [Thermoanaerobaculia bacterium]|nr:nucleotidyltransferase domain-containing protein [Thermoanaerobaculia bacterium]
MDTATIERRLCEFFAASPLAAEGIVTAYLFGSVARGEAGAASDVDVAVLPAAGPPPGLAGLYLRLQGELERHLGLPVQVTVLDGAPVDLIHRVLRDGRLLLERNPSRRIAFEVKARREFFDLQPILRRYRRMPAEG